MANCEFRTQEFRIWNFNSQFILAVSEVAAWPSPWATLSGPLCRTFGEDQRREF